MTGILGALPPGLQGYVASQQLREQRQAQELGMLAQVANLDSIMTERPYRLQALQSEAEMNPLKREQLWLAVERARGNNAFINRLSQGDSAPPGMLAPQAALAEGAAAGDVGPTATNAGRIPGILANPQSQTQQPTGGMLGGSGGGAGNIGGLPRDVAVMLLSGDAGLGKLGDKLAENYKPTDSMREATALGLTPGSPQFNAHIGTRFNQGGAWQTNPQGGVQLAPGYAAGMGEVKRAEAGANAGFDFVDVPMPNGGTQKMTRADAARALTQQISGISDRPLAEQEAIRDVAAASRIGRPRTVNVLPQNGPGQPFAVPASNVLRNAPIGFQRDETARTADKETATLRARSGVEREDKFRNGWGESNDMLGRLSLLETLARDPNVASGALADNVSGLKGVAESLGIKTVGLPAEEVIKAVTTEMSLKMKNQGGTNMMPGAMSDFEQKLLQSMTPRLSQSKEGRQLMIQVFRAKAERDMKISEMAADYVDKHGQLDSGFDREVRAFARTTPMFQADRVGAMTELARRLAGSR
jgi:hypothetical protein